MRNWMFTLTGIGGAHRHTPQLASQVAGFAVVIIFTVALIFWETETRPPYWALALPAAALLAATLWGALSSYRRLRALKQAPLLKIADAPPGCYVKFKGHAEPLPGPPLRSRVSGMVCCWYSYRLEEKEGNDAYRTIEQGSSDASFIIRDASGACVIDPEQAELIPEPAIVQDNDIFRYTESMIRVGEALVAEGEFGSSAGPSLEARAGQLVVAWKRDMPALLARFDADGDGSFSREEWEQVQQAARREAAGGKAAGGSAPAEHRLVKPRDGRPYLVSAQSEDDLDRRLHHWAGAHLLGFIAAGLGAGAITMYYWRIGYWQ